MGFKNQYPNSVNFCGLVTEVDDCGPSASSGKKVRVVIKNPSLENSKFDTYIRMLAFGNNAIMLSKEGSGEVIHVTGRIGAEGRNTIIIADKVFLTDEEPIGGTDESH
tara:strand:- start:10355 stop:10678 length:324 start_codon:yes stop_codon:yes gene_type:complete